MMTNTADALLERNVLDELASDPEIAADDIAVAVAGGVVTLSGTVPSIAQKRAAESAVKRVAGCRGIIEKLGVILSSFHIRGDAAIAAAALHALAWEITLPVGSVTVRVENGRLTLEGNVDWQFQVRNAERAVAHLFGVTGVTNNVHVVPMISGHEIAAALRATFARSAAIDAAGVTVETHDDTVTLRGPVRSWSEHDEAARAAYAVAGVAAVENLTYLV